MSKSSDSSRGTSNRPAPPATPASPTTQPPPPADDDLAEYEPLTPELVEEEALRGDVMLRWAVVLLAFLLGSTRIAETATLVHVKTGQYLASHGWWPPQNDVFSYTATNRSWTNLSWGFDLVAAGVHALGGFPGLSFIKALAAGVLFGVIVAVSRPGLPTWWGSICAALVLLACHERIVFQPALVTLLGMALVLSALHRWQQPGADKRRLWLLPLLFVVWCNLDSRAFLGAVALVLYAAGDWLGTTLKRPNAPDQKDRKQLWQVAAACVLALAVNPFGGRSLLAPWFVYAIEYPAFREYVSGSYVGVPVSPVGAGLLYFPMTAPTFWQHPGLAGTAALILIATCLAVCALNFRRIDPGQMLVLAGFLTLTVLSLHELPVASLVCGVLATLNGQAWYAARFRQTYSVDTRELLFSRGGRALTVLAFAAIALFGGTGRLRGTQAPRTGYGLDRSLAISLDDLSRQLSGERSFDHKPFNFLLTQGDQMIWIGEQVFADSRVGVYYAADRSRNLLAEHQQTREALQPPQSAAQADERASLWKLTFNEHGVTHIVPHLRLRMLTDYLALAGWLQDERHWSLTSLGATAAVLYRRDPRNAALDSYLGLHRLDFQERAFRQDSDPVDSRSAWVEPPSLYEKYLWSRKQEIGPEIQKATHLVRLATVNAFPPSYKAPPSALAYLGVRLAQRGLSADPESVFGYLALGQAYQILMAVDSIGQGPSPAADMRYLQAVSAYSLAIVGEPGNLSAHQGLSILYGSARRFDLWLRELTALRDLLDKDPDSGTARHAALDEQIAELETIAEKFGDRFSELPSGADSRLQRAFFAYSRGFVLQALFELDEESRQITGNLAAEQMRIRLLMEVGRIIEAYDAAEMFAEPARQSGVPDWANTVALTKLPAADYSQAQELWSAAIDSMNSRALTAALETLPPRDTEMPWPIPAIQAASNFLYTRPQAASRLKLLTALVRLEDGGPTIARQSFEEALAEDPETPARPLIAYYLYELTGKESADPLPPSERIPGVFAPDDEPSDDAASR